MPYGSPVTPEKLHQIEQAEAGLHDLGFAEVRVRHHGDIAGLEVPIGRICDIASPNGAKQGVVSKYRRLDSAPLHSTWAVCGVASSIRSPALRGDHSVRNECLYEVGAALSARANRALAPEPSPNITNQETRSVIIYTGPET